MKTILQVLGIAIFSTLLVSRSFAQQLNADESRKSQEGKGKSQQEYLGQLVALAESFTLTLEGRERVKPYLIEQPLFRWSNPQRQSDGGALFLWTIEGRPLATMGIWRMAEPGRNGYELQSFGEGRIKGTNEYLPQWETEKPAVQYKKIGDSVPPAANSQLRLRQMRQIALKRFTVAIKADRADSMETLRMLEKPLYRYDEKPEGVLDGAMFAFAQDTDPEFLLVIEAREEPALQTPAWYFAGVPATSHGVQAKLDGEVFADLPRSINTRAGRTFQLRFWNEQMLEELLQDKAE